MNSLASYCLTRIRKSFSLAAVSLSLLVWSLSLCTASAVEKLTIDIDTRLLLQSYELQAIRHFTTDPFAPTVSYPLQIYEPQYGSEDTGLYIFAYNVRLNRSLPSIFSLCSYPSNRVVDDDPVDMVISGYTISDRGSGAKVVVAGGYRHDSAFALILDPVTDSTEWLFLATGTDRTGDGVWTPEVRFVHTVDYDFDGTNECFFHVNPVRDLEPRVLCCLDIDAPSIEWSLPVAPIVQSHGFTSLYDSTDPGVIFVSYNPKQGAADTLFNDRFGYLTIVDQRGVVRYNRIVAQDHGGMGLADAEEAGIYYVTHALPFVEPDSYESGIDNDYRVSKIDRTGQVLASAASPEQLTDVWLLSNDDNRHDVYTLSHGGVMSKFDAALNLLARSDETLVRGFAGELNLSGATTNELLFSVEGGLAVCDRDFQQLSFHSGGASGLEPLAYGEEGEVIAITRMTAEGGQVAHIQTKGLLESVSRLFWHYRHYLLLLIILMLIVSAISNYRRLQTERQLHRSESSFRAYIEASPDLFFRLDRDGTLLAYDAKDASHLYRDPGEFIGKQVSEVLPADVSQKTLAGIEEVLRTGELQTFEYDLPMPDGTRHFESRIVPAAEGEVVAIVRDITASKTAQESLAIRIRYESGLASCSKALLAATTIEEALQEALRHLREASQACRVYVFVNYQDPREGLCARLIHEVHRSGLSSMLENPELNCVPYREFPRWQETLSRGEEISGPIRALPDNERAFLESYDISSVLAIPVFTEDDWFGFIGFDDTTRERDWNQEDVRPLKTAGEMIGSYYSILRSKRKLTEERDFTRSILDTANSIIVCLDEQARITVFNKELERLTGYSQAEVLGQSWPDLLVPEEQRHEGLDNFKEWVRQHPEDRYEGPILTRTGKTRTILWSNSSFVNPHTNKLTAIAIGHDITDRKQAEQALRDSEEMMRAQYNHFPVPTYTWRKTDEDFVLVNYNDAADSLANGRMKEFLGQSATVMWKNQPDIITDLRTCYDTHRVVHREIPFWYVTTGRQLILSVTYGYVPTNLVIVHTEDITERRRAEEALRASEARYQELFDSVMEGICLVDEHETIQFCNPSFASILEETTIADVIDKNMADYVIPEEREFIRSQTALRMTNVSSQYELNIVTGRNNRKTVFVSVAPRMNPEGNYVGAFGTIIDITDLKEVESELRETVEQLNATLEAIPDLLFEVDRDGRFYNFHSSKPEKLYVPPEAFLGKTVGEVLPAHVAEVITNAIDEAVKTGRHSGAVYALSSRSGAGWYELSIATKGDPSTARGRLIMLAHDITARVLAEKALRASEERYRSVFQHSPVAICLTDEHGVYRHVNPAYCSLVGYSENELLGRSFSEMVLIPEMKEEFLSVYDGLVAKTNRLFRVQTEIRDKSGRHLWVEVSTDSIEDEHGGTLVVGMLQDITARVKADQELKESEKRYRDLANLLPQTVFETDLKGRVTFTNRAGFEAFGYSPNDLKNGLNVAQLYAPSETQIMQENFAKRLKGQPVRHHEYQALRRDGTTFSVLVYSAPIRRENRVLGLRGVAIDVSELKAAEEQARNAEQARYDQIKEIAGGVSHEIYNSLFPAFASLDKLQESLRSPSTDDPARPERLIKLANNAIARAVKLTELVTQFSRIDSEQKYEEVEVRDVIAEVLESQQHRIEEQRITLKVDIEEEAQLVCFRPHAFSVINNLIVNALDALRESDLRQIEVVAFRHGDRTVIKVSDTGIGIPDGEQPKIFNAFYSTKPHSGTGMGLAIVKRIVDLYGGEVAVQSRLDKGTEFTIIL